MSNINKFYQHVSKVNLKEIYLSKIIYSSAIGVDNISSDKFNKIHINEIDIINNKVLNNSYSISKYKLKLVSKGKNKNPRDLYIPTIRDRLLLKVMNNFLLEIYQDDLIQDLPQVVIKSLKDKLFSENYDSYIKIDIKSFYPSISQDILIKIIKRKVRGKTFIRLLKQALNPKNLKSNDCIQGVPQGLSISNTLAHIYLLDIDNFFYKCNDLHYFRFVDDILILCNSTRIQTITSSLNSLFSEKKLEIYPPKPIGSKSKIGLIKKDSFEYLGYSFSNNNISVRDSSINNLRNGIVDVFTTYKYAKNKNIDFLRWRLDLKITGCIHEGKSRGWLFFYSQINDLSILYELDHFIQLLAKKFNVDVILSSLKKFTKAYYEINFNSKRTKYIPNFDKINTLEKINILEGYFGFSCNGLSDEYIDFEFQKRIRKQVNKLLVDLRNFS